MPAVDQQPGARRELTARALLLGCAIGAVLAAGNVYTGLKTSFIDGGSIIAALLGFTFFTTWKRLSRTPYLALENNITQTTASSAAIMSFVAGVPGALPALSMMGHSYPAWAIAAWGVALGFLGAGGMGEVWEARHERTKGRVALKVLLPEPGPGPRLGRARLRKRVDV